MIDCAAMQERLPQLGIEKRLHSLCLNVDPNWFHEAAPGGSPTDSAIIDRILSLRNTHTARWKRACRLAGVEPQIQPTWRVNWRRYQEQVPNIISKWLYSGDRTSKDRKRRLRYVENPAAEVWRAYATGNLPDQEDFEAFLDWSPYFEEFDWIPVNAYARYTLSRLGRFYRWRLAKYANCVRRVLWWDDAIAHAWRWLVAFLKHPFVVATVVPAWGYFFWVIQPWLTPFLRSMIDLMPVLIGKITALSAK